MNWLLFLHEACCLVLLYGVFCRSAKSSREVFITVRLAFWLLGISVCAAIVSPLAWFIYPTLPQLGLEIAFTAVQLACSVHWRDGAPWRFLEPEYRPKRRQTDRTST